MLDSLPLSSGVKRVSPALTSPYLLDLPDKAAIASIDHKAHRAGFTPHAAGRASRAAVCCVAVVDKAETVAVIAFALGSTGLKAGPNGARALPPRFQLASTDHVFSPGTERLWRSAGSAE